MDTLLEQATPQYEVPTHLLEVVGKALYGWGDDEPNEATGYTAVYESVQVAAAVHAAGYRLNAYEPLVKALRELADHHEERLRLLPHEACPELLAARSALDGAGAVDDFEDMLAGFDRILNDKELQQRLLDAGLVVRTDASLATVESSPEREGGE